MAIELRERVERFEKDAENNRHRTVTFAWRPLLVQHE